VWVGGVFYWGGIAVSGTNVLMRGGSSRRRGARFAIGGYVCASNKGGWGKGGDGLRGAFR